MARYGPNGRVPDRAQRFPENLLTRAQWNELQARRQRRWDRGQATDEDTVDSGDDEEEEGETEGGDDDAEAPVPEALIDLQARDNAVEMFRRTLLFSQGAATALYVDQAVQSLDTLREIDDDMIKEMCRAIRKPGDGTVGHSISELSVSRLKLLSFWAKHMWRTSRGVDDWTETTWGDISDLADQKSLEDDVKGSTAPSPPELTLDTKTAAASFTHLKTYLRARRSRKTGLPLDYMTRVNIRGPFDGPEDAPEDAPPYGHPDSPYVSIDEELTARAPILRHDIAHAQLAVPDEVLEANGPFEKGFLADSADVFDILHTVWGKSSWWTHCKAFTKTRNGRQAFRTLHAQLLGGPKAIASGAAILAQLQALRYEGDRRNFTFDKYVQLHMQQHNLHADLADYGVAPLSENLKILWFKEGITDKSFDVVKMNVIASPERYATFQAVQEAYSTFHRQRCLTDGPRARQVSAIRDTTRRPGPARSRSRGNSDRRGRGVFTKAELDACHVVDKEYSDDEYRRLTAVQKQKLWVMRNKDKEPGSGPSRRTPARSVAAASTSTGSSAKKRDRSMDMSDVSDGESVDDNASKASSKKWGRDRNRDNPAVAGRQPSSLKGEKN